MTSGPPTTNGVFLGLAALTGALKRAIGGGIAGGGGGFSEDLKDAAPEHLKCVITQDVYVDPVVLVQTGYTYEREAIGRWLRTRRTDPTTNNYVTCTDVVPNWKIRESVESWMVEKGYKASDLWELGEEEEEERGGEPDEERKKKRFAASTSTLPPPKFALVRCASGAPPANGEPTDKFGIPVGGRLHRTRTGGRGDRSGGIMNFTLLRERMYDALHQDVIVIFHALKRIALSSPSNLSIILASFGACVGGILVAFLIAATRIRMFLLTGKVSGNSLESSSMLSASSTEEQVVRAFINESTANSVAAVIGNVLWWMFILTMMWFTQHNAIHEHQHANFMRAQREAFERASNNRNTHRIYFPRQRHARFLRW